MYAFFFKFQSYRFPQSPFSFALSLPFVSFKWSGYFVCVGFFHSRFVLIHLHMYSVLFASACFPTWLKSPRARERDPLWTSQRIIHLLIVMNRGSTKRERAEQYERKQKGWLKREKNEEMEGKKTNTHASGILISLLQFALSSFSLQRSKGSYSMKETALNLPVEHNGV